MQIFNQQKSIKWHRVRNETKTYHVCKWVDVMGKRILIIGVQKRQRQRARDCRPP